MNHDHLIFALGPITIEKDNLIRKIHKFSDVAFRVEAGEGSTSVRQNDVAISSLWLVNC